MTDPHDPTLGELIERVKRLTLERDELEARSRQIRADMEVLVHRARELQEQIDAAQPLPSLPGSAPLPESVPE